MKENKNIVKPEMIQDDFFMGDYYLGCPKCKEAIIVPLFKSPEVRKRNRPKECSKCGAEFDWSDYDNIFD